MDNNGIGVIDSGVGGLTVVREIMRQLPRESVYYFGDTGRCPYGSRPKEEIRRFTLQMISFLTQFNIKALVIACNTATAIVYKEVSRKASIPIIGVIEPGARTAIKETKNGRIGVIGTIGTVQSGAYELALKRINPEILVYSQACPRFVPLVESGMKDRAEVERIVRESLQPLIYTGIDTLILGCTHYPLLAEFIADVMGEGVTLINSADETARELSAVLNYRGLLADDDLSKTEHHFFTSGGSPVFLDIARTWIEGSIDLTCVDLEKMTDCTLPWTKS